MEGLKKKKSAQRHPRASNKLFKERDEGNALVHMIQTHCKRRQVSYLKHKLLSRKVGSENCILIASDI